MKEEEKLEKKERKEPIKPIVLVPEVDKDGHTVFRCLSKNEEVFVKTALNNPHGIKIKSAEGKRCPIEPDKPYEKSMCKKIDKLFEKRKEEKEKREKEQE